MHIINILAPIFLLIGLGITLRRSGVMSEVFFKDCARLTYWIGLPALLFKSIAGTNFDISGSWKISMAMITASMVVVVISYFTSNALKLKPQVKKKFIQTSFHCNTAFVGLPVVMYAFGGSKQELVTLASMSVAPMIPFINFISIMVMVMIGKREADHSGNNYFSLFAKNLLLNPLVLSCILGMIFGLAGIELPSAFGRCLEALGKMAMPLALLSVGAALDFKKVKAQLMLSVTASFFNVAMLPFLGWLLCLMMGLSRNDILIALIFLACPVASTAYVYAQQLDGDSVLAGSMIVISTICSILSLTAVLILFL